MQELAQVSETMETAVCALGLVVGLVGITVGSVLILRAPQSSHNPQTQEPL